MASSPRTRPSKSPWRGRVVTAVLGTVAGWCFLVFGVGESLVNLSYDIPFAFRRTIVPAEVILVYMDEESHHELGNQPRFDLWDRSLHARLVDRLREAGATAVIFDVLFDTTNHPAADRALVDAVRRHGRVGVAAIVGQEMFNQQAVGTKPVRPFPGLLDTAAVWGMVETPDGEGAARQHYQGQFNIPSLAWKAAGLVRSNLPPMTEPRWMNYYGPPGTLAHESYHRVLAGVAPASAFSNKVVYVGALFSVGFTGGKGTDDWRTPYTRWAPHPKSPGVDINATTFLNLIRKDWLRRGSPVNELVALFLTGFVLAMLLVGRRPLAAAGLAGSAALAVTVVGCVLPAVARVWWPWMIVVAVQIPVVLGASVVVDLQRLHDSWQDLRQVLEAGRSGARPISAGPAAGPAAVAACSPDGGFVTSEVLDEMKRLRGSSGMSPVVFAGIADGTIECPHTVPDHQLLKNVGRGGYGEVWLARNVLGSYRAAKIVFRKKFKESEPYEREFAGIKRFEPISRSHPGFVQILHVGRDDSIGYFYYLMEAADDVARGPDIDDATYVPRTLRRAADERGLLPPVDCLRLGIALTGALGYLHDQGLIHRDIKPSNIIFVRGEPKLADIGLVTEIGEDRSLVGTEGYLPPREVFGTPSGDLYSLGMLLYEMSTGQHPRQFPELPNGFNERKPSAELTALNKIVLKACATLPKRGYATAEQMQADLAAALTPRRGFFQRRSRASE